jgi:hypothetical protein
MAKQRFILTSNLHRGTRRAIDQINEIIDEYQAQGFVLSVRQIFYQLVARDLIKNTHKEYKRIGQIICSGRDAGLIDWEAIEDRTREVQTHASWESPEDRIERAAASFQRDLWEDQPYRPEIWIEKAALIGVIEPVCDRYRVPYYATRGNNSQTMQHEAGQRFAEYIEDDLTPVVLFLSDHDPKGLDMHRDNIERLRIYATPNSGYTQGGADMHYGLIERSDIEVRRLGLTMEQVRLYNPPPNIAKESDTTTEAYKAAVGTDECWELDALRPDVIQTLIENELVSMIEANEWNEAGKQEDEERALLKSVAKNWAKVEKLLNGDEYER